MHKGALRLKSEQLADLLEGEGLGPDLEVRGMLGVVVEEREQRGGHLL